MPKLLVMTDVHLVPAPGTIIGLDPRQRLSDGLAHAAKAHADADRLIIMGDLADAGDAASYGLLRDQLDKAPWPVTLMLGNHDHRETFQSVFPELTDANGHLQNVFDMDNVRIITLDTLDDDPAIPHSGKLCPTRLAGFKDALNTDRPCLVFMHHPPFQIGFPELDGIALQDIEAFRQILKTGPVAHLFAGHVHRTVNASIDGIAMTLLKGTCHQTPMRLGMPGFGDPIPEPAAYGIVITNGADVVVHFEDYTLSA